LDFVFTALKKKHILPYGYDYIIYQYAALLDYFEIILRQSTMMKQVEFMREKLEKKLKICPNSISFQERLSYLRLLDRDVCILNI